MPEVASALEDEERSLAKFPPIGGGSGNDAMSVIDGIVSVDAGFALVLAVRVVTGGTGQGPPFPASGARSEASKKRRRQHCGT